MSGKRQLERWYLQQRWGGFQLVARERLYGVTVAAGSFEAMWAALRLLNPPSLNFSWITWRPTWDRGSAGTV